ncbi:cytochrome P450 [Bradyrhizobium sp. JR4.1]|uniref:cytochrome P450 n=1 Tax=unclassified Bradyrhizobium TaxID=2631580 RepID=UPI003395CDB0
MQDTNLDQAIVDDKTYGALDRQHVLFSTLRKEDPVHWTEPPGFRPFWTISKHQDVIEIERQNERFINAPRTKLLSIDFETKVREAMAGRPMLVRAINHMDNPDHAKYKKITHAWFQPREVRHLEDRIALIARTSVDQMLEKGTECDFYKDVAGWYPLKVIMLILGIPDEHGQRLLDITRAYFGGGDAEMQRGNDLIDATFAYVNFFKEVARERRQNPTDDLASIIATAEVDGKPIGEFETSSYYVALASAGHDTTSATLSGGLLALIENPGEMRKLKENPDLIPAAVEEMVRWVSPVKHFFRTATETYTLRGKTIKQGDNLLMAYPSANRDEDAFERPFAFIADRTPNRHVGFGFGIHACLGMYLAKVEMIAFMRELLSRVDGIELAGEPAWTETTFVGGLKRLPIRFSRLH